MLVTMAATRVKIFQVGWSGTNSCMISDVESNLGFGRGGSRSTNVREWWYGSGLEEPVGLPYHEEYPTFGPIVRHEIPRQLILLSVGSRSRG